MSTENKDDEMIRQILDEKSLASLNNLKHINKYKSAKLQDMIIQYFNRVHKRVSYLEYLDIVNKLEEASRSEIRFKRKNDMFDLSDIE
jgi:DNA-binding TFAR19-related protein (PDSD5 family)